MQKLEKIKIRQKEIDVELQKIGDRQKWETQVWNLAEQILIYSRNIVESPDNQIKEAVELARIFKLERKDALSGDDSRIKLLSDEWNELEKGK